MRELIVVAVAAAGAAAATWVALSGVASFLHFILTALGGPNA